jgi:plasmid stabilization system protein ParE
VSAPGYRFHPAATEELAASGDWYDAQLPGLSLDLFDAVEEAIALIVERPSAWQRDGTVSGREIRRFVMRRFPFSIVYYVVDDNVRIVAVAHGKRRPGYWRVRVRDDL